MGKIVEFNKRSGFFARMADKIEVECRNRNLNVQRKIGGDKIRVDLIVGHRTYKASFCVKEVGNHEELQFIA